MKYLLLLLLPLLVCSCEIAEEDEEEVRVAPPITQVNSFSCKINDELFLPEPWGLMPRLPGILLIGQNWVVSLHNGDGIVLDINLEKNEPDGRLEIVKADGDRDFLYDDYNSLELFFKKREEIYISHNNTGTVKILKWVKDSILIMKFEELTLYQKHDPSKTIILTEGKLNINLATLEE